MQYIAAVCGVCPWVKYFRDTKRHAAGDLRRSFEARGRSYRENFAAAAPVPPGREAYPGDVFLSSFHALLEARGEVEQ